MMPSWTKLLILIAVIVLIFGTKKLRTLGSDLGEAIKGFKKAMNDDDDKKISDEKLEQPNQLDSDKKE
ncbi:twin-arginine translocase TatA/TatE family subunit [Utexia brackfieldae]|uniref:twin-arginine translocase TatA/TatE family subunit n=1 Tax=Utexia brackfieldae TaxID=3074108 RepID=UPI00370D125F